MGFLHELLFCWLVCTLRLEVLWNVLGGAISSFFLVNTEVRQGCILATSLFNNCMEWVLGRVVDKSSCSICQLKQLLSCRLAALSDRKLEAFITEAEANFFEHRLKCGGPLTIKTAIAETVSHLATALKTWRMTGDQRKSMTQINKILKNLMVNGMVECSGREQCWHSIEGMNVLRFLFIVNIESVLPYVSLYLLHANLDDQWHK